MRFEKIFLCLIASVLMIFSCGKKEGITKKEADEAKVKMAESILKGDVVLFAKTYIEKEDKTIVPGGCPAKFNFSFGDGFFEMGLINFKVGNMPFPVSFKSVAKFYELNDYEKAEYPGGGWMRFSGKDGNVNLTGEDLPPENKGSGAVVEGYFNIRTSEITALIHYNVFNVSTSVFLQKIDKSMVEKYEQKLEEYQRKLKEYKEHEGKP